MLAALFLSYLLHSKSRTIYTELLVKKSIEFLLKVKFLVCQNKVKNKPNPYKWMRLGAVHNGDNKCRFLPM